MVKIIRRIMVEFAKFFLENSELGKIVSISDDGKNVFIDDVSDQFTYAISDDLKRVIICIPIKGKREKDKDVEQSIYLYLTDEQCADLNHTIECGVEERHVELVHSEWAKN